MPRKGITVGEVMNIQLTKYEALAELLLIKCSINGIRDKAGKIMVYRDEDRLSRALAKFFKDTIKGHFYIERKE